MNYVIYTYQQVNGETVCHVFGPTTEDNAQRQGENFAASAKEAGQPELRFMVLPLEALPV